MDGRVVDAEVHVLPPSAVDPRRDLRDEPVFRKIHRHPDFPALRPLLTIDGLLASMDRSGITHAIIMGLPWLDRGLAKDNNRFVAECVRSHPDRFRGLYIPDPRDPRGAAKEIERLDESIFLGVKLVPSWQGVNMDSPALRPIWQAVEARGFIAMLHVDHPIQSLDGDSPFRLLHLLKSNPKLKVVAAHLGGLLCLYGLLPNIRNLLRNCWFVTSVSATMEMVSFAASILPRRIIFGSDFPFNHCHSQSDPLDQLRHLSISSSVLERITVGTALELFGWPDG